MQGCVCVLVQRWWRTSRMERKLTSGLWAASSTRWLLYSLHSTAVTCCHWPTRSQRHTNTHVGWISFLHCLLLFSASDSVLADCRGCLRAARRRRFLRESHRHDQMVRLLFWNNSYLLFYAWAKAQNRNLLLTLTCIILHGHSYL